MNRTILSLSILKVNWEKKKQDYIDNFVSLLGNLVYQKGYEEIDPKALNDLAEAFKQEYGLLIPRYALLTICNRASKGKRQLLHRENGVFYVNKTKTTEYDFSKASKEIELSFSHIIGKIQQFAKDKYGVDVAPEDITDAIIHFLKQNDLDILFGAQQQLSVLPRVSSLPKLKYIVSAYALEAQSCDPESFKELSNLAIGNALACAILYSEPTYQGKLRSLNLYIDTPLILALLGFSGDFKKSAFEEFICILNEEHVNLKILETTRREVDNILDGCLKILESGKEIEEEKASLTLRHCIRYGITASDLELKIVGLDDLLNKYGIVGSKLPDYIPNKQFQIDEEELKQTIIDVYKSNKPDYIISPWKEKTIERDVKVLSGIYRFRQGDKPRSLRDAKNLFLTSNAALAFASRKYEQKECNDSMVIPTCLTDVFVSTFIWLQSPQKTYTLNEKKFLADCFASIQPSEALIKAFLAEVDKLKNNNQIGLDDYYLLRSTRVAMNMLEERTLGDPEFINGETVSDILDRIKASIKSEEAEKLEIEKRLHGKTKRELEEERQKNRLKDQKVDKKIEKWAEVCFHIICIVASCLIAFLVISSTYGMQSLSSWLTWSIILILVGLNVWSLICGGSLFGLRDKIIKYFKKMIMKVLYGED